MAKSKCPEYGARIAGRWWCMASYIKGSDSRRWTVDGVGRLDPPTSDTMTCRAVVQPYCHAVSSPLFGSGCVVLCCVEYSKVQYS